LQQNTRFFASKHLQVFSGFYLLFHNFFGFPFNFAVPTPYSHGVRRQQTDRMFPCKEKNLSATKGESVMKKTSFLKKLTAMAATLAMTCVTAVGAFAAEPTVDYKLDSASIHVGETWTMEVPAGNIYDWNLSSEYIAFGPSMADKEGVLKQVGYETANGVSTITYEAMMPGTCTVTLTDRSFAKVAEATVTVTDGSATPDTPSVDTPSTDNKAAETSAAAAVSTAPVDTRTAQQREIDEAKANGTWGIEYTTCQKCGYHNWTRKGNVYVCDTCGNETTTVVSANGVKGYVGNGAIAPIANKSAAPETRYATAKQAQDAADAREAAYAAAVVAFQKQIAANEAAYLAAIAK